jgi:DNA-binding response OmpR family regulator
MQAGAAHYVTKPVNIERLLALLDRLLEGIDTRFGTLD